MDDGHGEVEFAVVSIVRITRRTEHRIEVVRVGRSRHVRGGRAEAERGDCRNEWRSEVEVAVMNEGTCRHLRGEHSLERVSE